MRGIIVIIAIACLLSGCTIGHNKYTPPKKWDYMTPEHVSCSVKQTKLCRQHGAYLICECIV